MLAFVISGCAFPEESFDGTLAGDYFVNGVDQQGTEYSGRLTVTATDDPDVYDMQWIITGSVQAGTGTLDGHQLRVEWHAIEGYDASSHGDAVYEITSEGELHGERTVAGATGTATEEVFPIR